MSTYDKLKNDDLKKILTERGLPTTGKKADFVARLTEHDANQSSSKAPDSDNEAKHDKAAPEPAVKQKSASAATPETPKDDSTNTTHNNNNAKATNNTTSTTSSTPSKEQIKSNDDREAKLAARAARFGIPKDEEEERRKARAARFGTEHKNQEPSAAPEDKPLSQPKAKKSSDKKENKKDTSTGTAAAADAGKPGASKESEAQKRKVSVLDDPVEAEKARKRALKFGTAPATTSTTQEASKAPATGIASTS